MQNSRVETQKMETLACWELNTEPQESGHYTTEAATKQRLCNI